MIVRSAYMPCCVQERKGRLFWEKIAAYFPLGDASSRASPERRTRALLGLRRV